MAAKPIVGQIEQVEHRRQDQHHIAPRRPRMRMTMVVIVGMVVIVIVVVVTVVVDGRGRGDNR